MESPAQTADTLTPSQRQAVVARGNVLVMAGAGTGKTKTLVARCLDCLERDRASLDELLVVTFTEAAAAEMRQRLRLELEKKSAAAPTDDHWPRQLALFDIAHIGTLHGFCLRLVREHFHELGLDPQLAMLDEGEARQLATETLADQFHAHYAGEDAFSLAAQELIRAHCHGRDEKIRALILRLHHYSQTRPDAAGWLADQVEKFSATAPTDWQHWLTAAIHDWRDTWRPVLENLRSNEKAAELAAILERLKNNSPRETAAEILDQVLSADGEWPPKRKTALRKPLEDLFADAAFLSSLATVKNGADPLVEDWNWVRGHMTTLLQLAQEFAEKFAARKRADGVLDFHDLEQFALRLLWNFSADGPTPTADIWRAKLRFVFVDEYQDINAAQDRIIAALARDGAAANRFLVGDVKQSIYRFRLADPKIFRDYARNWRARDGQTIALSENFRSRQGLLDFANSVFSLVMREEVGGVAYDEAAQLRSGRPQNPSDAPAVSAPRVELLLRWKNKSSDAPEEGAGDLAEVEDSAREAQLIAAELKQLVTSGHEIQDRDVLRPVKYGDLAVLLRSPRGKSEVYAKEFERAGVPLTIARGDFFQSAEILDFLSLLRLLDNPLQDVPCIAVLRSPLVGLSLDELAQIRLAAPGKHFWTALLRFRETAPHPGHPLAEKTARFLKHFTDWRRLARQASLSDCLATILAETLYADWLRTRPRGAQRVANLQRFLNLAEQFDQFQRQGLFRFLKFIEAQEEAGSEPEVPAVAPENAVRLMSIHQSKGLEFPVVALPDLAKTFNEQDLHAEIIFDEELGLCPRVKPPQSGRHYPSLPHWLAHRRQKRELRGEELRLLYVALTRARDTLLLSATITEGKWKSAWLPPVESMTPQKIAGARSFSDWLGLWFARNATDTDAAHGETPLLRWRFAEAEPQMKEDSADVGITTGAENLIADLDAPTAAALQDRLSRTYPHLAATQRKAKSSVTELRRAAEELDDEAEPFLPRPRRAAPRRSKTLSAAETGTAHHKFLQHVHLTQTTDLAAESDRLEREGFISPEERTALDLLALAAFWNSPLGEKIRTHADEVQRELPFTARFSPTEIADIIGGATEQTLADEFIVVQGVADLVVLLPKEIWLVDFKTDEVRADGVEEKVKLYRPQLQLYSLALEQIYSRPVTLCALHFLTARRTVKL